MERRSSAIAGSEAGQSPASEVQRGPEAAGTRAMHRGQSAVAGRRAVGPSGCVSPGCEHEPAEGARFCAAHQEVLDRVRAELEREESSQPRRRRGPGRAIGGLSAKPGARDQP